MVAVSLCVCIKDSAYLLIFIHLGIHTELLENSHYYKIYFEQNKN